MMNRRGRERERVRDLPQTVARLGRRVDGRVAGPNLHLHLHLHHKFQLQVQLQLKLEDEWMLLPVAAADAALEVRFGPAICVVWVFCQFCCCCLFCSRDGVLSSIHPLCFCQTCMVS